MAPPVGFEPTTYQLTKEMLLREIRRAKAAKEKHGGKERTIGFNA